MRRFGLADKGGLFTGRTSSRRSVRGAGDTCCWKEREKGGKGGEGEGVRGESWRGNERGEGGSERSEGEREPERGEGVRKERRKERKGRRKGERESEEMGKEREGRRKRVEEKGSGRGKERRGKEEGGKEIGIEIVDGFENRNLDRELKKERLALSRKRWAEYMYTRQLCLRGGEKSEKNIYMVDVMAC